MLNDKFKSKQKRKRKWGISLLDVPFFISPDFPFTAARHFICFLLFGSPEYSQPAPSTFYYDHYQ